MVAIDEYLEDLRPDDHVLGVRLWYEELAEGFREFAGEDDWIWVASAWAVTQERGLSAKDGMVIVASCIGGYALGGRALPSGVPVPDDLRSEVIALLEAHEPLKRDYGALLFDLTDSLLGRSVRTVMGDDPRGRAPVPVDIWAYRDVGFIDPEWKEHLTKKYGAEQTQGLAVDEQGEDQYEYIVDFYNDLAVDLNEQAYLGIKDWRPYQLQALGRHAIQTVAGIPPVTPNELVDILRSGSGQS